MAREILFKAKRKDNGEWVEGGSLITFLDNGEKSFFMPQFNEKCICEHDEMTDDILSFSDCRFYKVDPETICRYTGLKDKNGKLIWENDILNRCNIVVKWKEELASYCLTKKGWMYQHFFGEAVDACDCEVVGNIFDNPELLETGKESGEHGNQDILMPAT